MPDIMHLIKIAASRQAVYEALTTPEGIRAWWTKDADLDTHIDGVGEFRFYSGSSITKVRVAELDPPRHILWHTLSSFRPEWLGTTLSFELRPIPADPSSATVDESPNGTLLAFAHRGFAHPDDIYALTTTGWESISDAYRDTLNR